MVQPKQAYSWRIQQRNSFLSVNPSNHLKAAIFVRHVNVARPSPYYFAHRQRLAVFAFSLLICARLFCQNDCTFWLRSCCGSISRQFLRSMALDCPCNKEMYFCGGRYGKYLISCVPEAPLSSRMFEQINMTLIFLSRKWVVLETERNLWHSEL